MTYTSFDQVPEFIRDEVKKAFYNNPENLPLADPLSLFIAFLSELGEAPDRWVITEALERLRLRIVDEDGNNLLEDWDDQLNEALAEQAAEKIVFDFL